MTSSKDLKAAVEAAVEAARDTLTAAGSMRPAVLFAPVVIAALNALKDSDEQEPAAQLKNLFGFDPDIAEWAIRYSREQSGDELVESIADLLGGHFLPVDDNYAVLEKLVFERAFYVASWASFGGMTSGGVDWDGVEVRGSVYWRMRGDTDDGHFYQWSYDVSDHASREAAYRNLNEELLITHREIETGDATDESEDASFVPVTWPQTEDQG